jgi:hypothetical protein
MNPIDHFSDQFKRILEEGRTVEDAISELKRSGANIVYCILAYSIAADIDMDEAKRIVHYSEAWSGQQEMHNRFHKRAMSAFEEGLKDEGLTEDI